MKIQRYSMGIWLALALALAAATAVSTPALAKCYDKLQNEIPCPKTDYKLKQPTATYPPKPTETPTPQALSEQAIVVTPDAAQLAILCANVPGGGSSTGGNPGSPAANTPPGPSQSGLSPFLLGVGGLLGGILIGLLLPFMSRLFRGGIIGPVDDEFGGASAKLPGGRDGSAKVFPKMEDRGQFYKGQDAGFGKLAPPPPGIVAEPPGPPQDAGFGKLAPPPPGIADMPPGPPSDAGFGKLAPPPPGIADQPPGPPVDAGFGKLAPPPPGLADQPPGPPNDAGFGNIPPGPPNLPDDPGNLK